MPEAQTEQAAPAVTQGNEAAARTETGEIKDQQTTQPAGSANQETTKSTTETEPKSTDDKAKPDFKA